MRRSAAWIGLALLALGVVLVVRAARLPSRQLEAEPAPRVDIDSAALARRLAGGLRFRTVSHQDRARLDAAAFLGFQRYLEESYPAAHAALERETVAAYSLLYTWKGRDPSLPAVLLLAHQDVVPVEAGTEDAWQQPAFAGVIADGFVWGRGAMDDKGSIFCLFEAVEALLAQGFRPERTVHLAFGHDEEVGGDDGARRIAELLASRGVAVAYVLDEGGMIVQGFLSGVDLPIAVIGIAEKGSVSIALDIEVPGGHSSIPPRHTAIGELASAIEALERHPIPGGVDRTTALFFDSLAPELPFGARVVLANRWLFGPVLEVALSRVPTMNAMLRTTTAVTIFEGGVKENVLPSRARAVVNFRIRPGDTIESVAEHVRRTVDDDRIQLKVGVRSQPRNPSPVSRVDGEAFTQLARTIREVFPGTIVAPYLVLGGTDARHYAGLSDSVYRFGPWVYGRDSMQRAHGTDERISVEGLGDAVRFYRRLIRRSAGGGQPPSG